jgi:hypothetical protein
LNIARHDKYLYIKIESFLMKLFELLDQKSLDKPTFTLQDLADKYSVPLERIESELEKGMQVEMEHTTDPNVAAEIALDHLAERLDYYEALSTIDEVYPGQSSGKLKNFIKKRYGGEISCNKVAKLKRNPDISKFYKKRASWYQSLNCNEGEE